MCLQVGKDQDVFQCHDSLWADIRTVSSSLFLTVLDLVPVVGLILLQDRHNLIYNMCTLFQYKKHCYVTQR